MTPRHARSVGTSVRSRSPRRGAASPASNRTATAPRTPANQPSPNSTTRSRPRASRAAACRASGATHQDRQRLGRGGTRWPSPAPAAGSPTRPYRRVSSRSSSRIRYTAMTAASPNHRPTRKISARRIGLARMARACPSRCRRRWPAHPGNAAEVASTKLNRNATRMRTCETPTSIAKSGVPTVACRA